MEFRAGLWAGDINVEVLCIWVGISAKKLNEILWRIKVDQSLKTALQHSNVYRDVGNEEKPQKWRPREEPVLGEGSDHCGSESCWVSSDHWV